MSRVSYTLLYPCANEGQSCNPSVNPCCVGLSCDTTFLSCYNDPRQVGDPCSLTTTTGTDACAAGLQCVPGPYTGLYPSKGVCAQQ